MGSNYSIVNFNSWLREFALTQETWVLLVILSKGEEVIDIGYLTEMGTDWIQEQ